VKIQVYTMMHGQKNIKKFLWNINVTEYKEKKAGDLKFTKDDKELSD
jgi:hypothetical protein